MDTERALEVFLNLRNCSVHDKIIGKKHIGHWHFPGTVPGVIEAAPMGLLQR